MLSYPQVMCAANAVKRAIVLSAKALDVSFKPGTARGDHARTVTLRVDGTDGHWLYRDVKPYRLVIELPPDAKAPLNVSIASLETGRGERDECDPAISVAVSDAEAQTTSAAPPMPPGPRVDDPPLSCAEPFRQPKTIQAARLDMPPLAHEQMISGTVVVAVLIDPTGAATDAGIISSASPLLNEAALKAARGSTYQPAIFRCAPAAGMYTFTAEFTNR